ncbi:MAG TPA: DUF1109 domain-containing protein [Rhizomicrobium sp.]|jgi:hypothetical protein
MATEDLIARLSTDLQPSERRPVLSAFAMPLAIGIAASLVLMLAWLGLRPDLATAMTTSAYWMKFFYTLLFAASAFWLAERMARPGTSRDQPMVFLAFVLLAIAGIGMIEMMRAPPLARHHLMMGGSADVCPWRIVLLGIPLLAASLWAMRRMAPTRLMLAGWAAGLFAGAAGAFIYAFHCTESAAPFVAIWYTAGITLTALIGAVAGRWLLRW